MSAATNLDLEARSRVVVVGKTGSGKSHWVKAQCAQWMKSHRLIVFDVCDEYSQHGRKGEALGPLKERCTVDELLNDPREYLDRRRVALSVVSEGDPDEVADDFLAVSQLLKHTGNVLFVVEEVGYFSDVKSAYERLKTVATMYRHHGVAVVFVSQRAVQVPKTARSQASAIVAFRQDEPDDLDALRLRCGTAIPDIDARVSRLRVGESVTWRDIQP